MVDKSKVKHKKELQDDGELLDYITKGKGARIETRLRMFKSVPMLDIREWLNDGDKVIKTNRGITLPLSRITDLLSLLSKTKTILELRG